MKNLKLCGVALLSIFILTQCASQNRAPQRVIARPSQPQQPVYRYSPPYYVPNSRAYSNPYDLAPAQGYYAPIDNDQTYQLPREYFGRQ